MRWHERVREHCEVWLQGIAGERLRSTALRNTDELEFLPAALEIGETPPPFASRAILYTIVAVFCVALVWATFSHVDIVASASGRLTPSGKVKVIQPLDTAVVRAIHVRDGDEVQEGQLLVELDPTAAAADHQRISQELTASSIDVARLGAQVKGLDRDELSAPEFDAPEGASAEQIERARQMVVAANAAQRAEAASLARERDGRKADALAARRSTERIEGLLPMMRERYAARERLTERKISSRSELLELREQLVSMEKELEVLRANQSSSLAASESSDAKLAQLRAETRRRVLTELGEAEKRVAALQEELKKAEKRLSLDRLNAPTHGYVQQLAIHTPGGVVTPAQPLMVIVPADQRVEVEASVLNQDVGFVHEGQAVEVKIDALPFSKYGTVPGKLVMLSRDAVLDETKGLVYQARVELERDELDVDGRMVRLTPGMSVVAELKTGERRLIEFALGPLLRYRDTAFRER
jgi:hemolysin D